MRFLDPLYGVVQPSALEQRLLFSPEVQRLRYVRMCNINSLYITGASEPSRFEHIIGVLHLAQIWSQKSKLNVSEKNVFHSASILHDMQTAPFGHSLEYILDDNLVEGGFDHEGVLDSSNRGFLQSITAATSFCGKQFSAKTILGETWSRVANTIEGVDHCGPILSAELDIDNIDNVLRLAYHVGIVSRETSRKVAESLVRDMELDDGRLTLSSAGCSLVEQWQQVREKLYLLLLHDAGEFAAKAMLTRVLEDAVALGILGADSWILTDDGLIQFLLNKLTGEGQVPREILTQLIRGDLYTPILMVKIPGSDHYPALANIEKKRSIETKISRLVGGRSIFHVIKDKNKTRRRVFVRNRDFPEDVEIGTSSNETLIGVFASSSHVQNSMTVAVRKLIHDELAQLGHSEKASDLPDPLLEVLIGEVPSQSQMELFDAS